MVLGSSISTICTVDLQLAFLANSSPCQPCAYNPKVPNPKPNPTDPINTNPI